jgi:chromate reductase
MENTIKLVGISGSLRKGSFNTMLIHAAKELLPEGMEMEIISFEEVPVYNADNDTPAAGERPESVRIFRDALAKADGIVIATPEYNYSIPGGLKNAIDWASRGTDAPLMNKAVAIMGATPGIWGTVRGQHAFHPIFQFLNMTSVRKPEVFIAKASEKFDESGKLHDEMTRKVIGQQLAELKKLIIQIKKA